ncbi:CamS family sex pheromone protein [Aquibacillus halophilus]|uniref:CamS family sex pheromone protein n=1 Tax=Aquibacillus halophilus TaxID=930132 RepID=A0A6A8DH66_9BACI|nr:CamS family sex pheromone protein [Aquibacillus halophilus]MRH44570.1 CamS family sex pheromone protein [Aquibacillus halophilus]
MVRLKVFLMIMILLILASCAPSFNKQDEVIEENQDESRQETAIIPSYNISDENYRVLLPYKISKARGVIVNQVANRLDIDEFEEGLMRHSKDAFEPDNYFFQEGQYITQDMVYGWLERYEEGEDELGLNPELNIELDENDPDYTEELIDQEEENPKYLSHILEQNYLTKTDENVVQLGGISIGIALKSTYRFQTEIGGPYYYEDISEDEMLEEANGIAQEVLERIRQIAELETVPVMIALYREESYDSIVPGSFISKTVVSEGSSINEWESIDEEYVLFPTTTAKENYPDTSANLADFEQDVADYFPNYTSVIGKGFYADEQLQKLTIEIPVSFNGKAEIVGFTQYVYGLVMDGFQSHYALEINITSNDRQEGLISRKIGEDEPTVHIYH